ASRVEGKSVVTHEGLGEATRQRWADCFAVAGASQCGFCSPGIVMKAEALPEPERGAVGARALRYRAAELALGDKPFVADLVEPGMLHGALAFSAHPRARVVLIDTSKAEAHPGVVAVVTA